MSINLGNSAHLDLCDTSLLVALWLEERPGQAINWYFIQPNLTYDDSSGGGGWSETSSSTGMSSDARTIFHCTTKRQRWETITVCLFACGVV